MEYDLFKTWVMERNAQKNGRMSFGLFFKQIKNIKITGFPC